MYQPRTYRHWVRGANLVSYNISVKETDLHIRTRRNLRKKAYRAVLKYREAIEGFIDRHPSFLNSLDCLPDTTDAPQIVRDMAWSARAANTGPMAAVAGALAEAVGRELEPFSRDVIVENGGDIYLKTSSTRLVGVYAGSSPLSGRIAIEIRREDSPVGICTSSGTVGHSLSFGNSDATIVLARSAALADAVATAAGNLVAGEADIEKAVEFSRRVDGVKGVVVIKGERMGVWGQVKMVPVLRRRLERCIP